MTTTLREAATARVCLFFTVMLASCAPALRSSCETDADCAATTPVCRCDGLCWEDEGPPVLGDTDTERFVLVAMPTGLSISGTTARGVDLDGRVGGDPRRCDGQADFIQADTGSPGVDDQIALMLPLLDGLIGGDGWEGATNLAFTAGLAEISLEVGPVDGRRCERRVRVARVDAVLDPPMQALVCRSALSDASCAGVPDEACVWSPADFLCGGVASGQSWRVIEDLGVVSARIHGERLRTEPLGRLPITPAIRGSVASIDLHDAVLALAIRRGPVVAGDVGGMIHTDELVSWLNGAVLPALGLPPTDPTTLTELAPADLTPDAEGVVCADYSAGFGIRAVAGTVVP